MSLLSLCNVGKTYYSKSTETNTLRNINFTVGKGEFVAVIGPSGCGKTTLLSLISGIVPPTQGKILLQGQEILSTTNEVGYMLQHDHLFEWRTILQNITLGLEIQKKLTKETVQQAKELAQKYGLGDFLNHFPRQLSGGMRQRVALIRTLALCPKLLLLDEPFSALDFQTRMSVCNDVHAIMRTENSTAMLVTHDISEAISMADKIVILTERPATVLRVHHTNFPDGLTPLERREHGDFAKQFEEIWKEISHEK